MVQEFDWTATYEWLEATFVSWKTLGVACLLYPFVVFWAVGFMKQRKAIDGARMKNLLFAWNVILSLGSGFCGYYVLREMLFPQLSSLGFSATVCDRTIYRKSAAVFVMIFNYSKFFEWIDTLFLVLRKRNVGFLHWFHHAITAVYCLHATHFSGLADASGIFFCGVNLFVHFVMYGYYALVTMPAFQSVKKIGFVLTILQTSQMVLGLTVVFTAIFSCAESWEKNASGHLFGLGMYAVYFYLFFKLMVQKWRGSGAAPSKKTIQKLK